MNPNKAPIQKKILAALIFKLGSWVTPKRNLNYVVEVLDFAKFVRVNFGRVEYMSSREKIWEEIEKQLSADVIFLEFGVAYGYMTSWWLEPQRTQLGGIEFVYYGFDTFQGLPSPWREFSIGTFSTDGIAPNINNSNLKFQVGLVEHTLTNDFIYNLSGNSQLILLFDLDLFEPTLFVYEKLKSRIKTGDIIYFDEARDAQERRVLENYVMRDFVLQPLAVSYSNIAFRISGYKH